MIKQNKNAHIQNLKLNEKGMERKVKCELITLEAFMNHRNVLMGTYCHILS